MNPAPTLCVGAFFTAMIPILTCFALISAVVAPFSALSALLLLPAALLGKQVIFSRNKGVLSWLVIAWLVWLPFNLVYSLSPGLSISHVAVLSCLPLSYMAGKMLMTRVGSNDLLLRTITTLLLCLLFWGLVQGPNTITHKPQGPFNDPNTYAAVLNLMSLPLLARYLASDLAMSAAWWRTCLLALLAASSFLAFMVASRGASIALLLVLPPLLWTARHQPAFMRKILLLGVVVMVSYITATAVTNLPGVLQRLGDTVKMGDPSRLLLMHSAWLMIQEHPWLGTGLGTFRLLYPMYRFPSETSTRGGWVHNDYLQLWLEAGLPMLVLSVGLAFWVAVIWFRMVRRSDSDTVQNIGYLAGITTVLLHSSVNFLFYFSLISSLLGFYLAKISTVSSPGKVSAQTYMPRVSRLALGGYSLIMGLLFSGQVAVETLLDQAPLINKVMLRISQSYPRYDVAYWVSILAPFHPTPQQVMGLELADLYEITGRQSTAIRDEALSRMEASAERAPCYLPYANDALALLSDEKPKPDVLQRADKIMQRSLVCNARHGLTYYYAGLFAKHAGKREEAVDWWHAGLQASSKVGDRILLASAILSEDLPAYSTEFTAMNRKMADSLRALEANPMASPDQEFWMGVQYKLIRLAKARYLTLLDPSAP